MMDTAYLSSTEQALQHFEVNESQGLSDRQVQKATEKYGRNGIVHAYALNFKQREQTESSFLQRFPKTLRPLYGNSSSNSLRIS